MPTNYENFSFSHESNRIPIALILPEELEVVVGSVVKLDGRSSIDPEGAGLVYTWSFAQTPIGSQVDILGFTSLEDDSSVVSFAPDITGSYRVQLTVSDGSLVSEPSTSLIGVRVILVPHHQGFIPDASFIWNYLSDFWNLVDGRKKFETFWSSAIQIVSSELLKLYQYDYAKSIRDIQEVIQKRWLSYSPGLKIDRAKVSFILADDQAGLSAATYVYDPLTGLPNSEQPLYSNTITVPSSEGSFSASSGVPISVGRLIQVGDRSFTMKRAQSVQLSETYGLDGVSSGVSSFSGSMFTEEMEGSILRILSHSGTPPIIGDFIIDDVIDDETLSVIVPAGTAWSSHSNIEYTVLPSPGNHSSFFADQNSVPTGNEDQAWRFSSTLVSEEYDFESMGSLPGDVIQVEVTRIDINLTSIFFAQVVSVDRNRLGFVLNLEDLEDGQSARWMTEDIQAVLSLDLQVTGVSAAPNKTLVYTGQGAAIKSVLESSKFRRTYFEKVLTPDTEISVGPFSVKIRPVQVIRNSKIAVDKTVVSIPILQEYIKQPDVAIDNDKMFFLYGDRRLAVSREPYILSENLDYVIDDESSITGVCQTVFGSDEVVILKGDLLDRSIQEQDTLILVIGTTQHVYDIRRVLSSEKIRVAPVVAFTSSSVPFVIKRRVPGTFIRFIPGTFGKKSPAPSRLWSEITYFDNNDAIEANFGVMVGILREDLDNIGSTIPYKSSVAGLMYALSRGPTVANLELSAQILLGLPFSQSAGIIREINPDYRKRDDGSPRYGRVLIEDVNKKNVSTGITHIYLYPRGRQIPDPNNPGKWLPAVPEFSGLAVNPTTNKDYVVGDQVRQFAPLSKGVEIEEYLTNAGWASRLIAQGNSAINLQKYHSFNLIVNADLVSSADVDLMAKFIKKAKAHYTRMSVGLLRALEDFVEIEDRIAFSRPVKFFDMVDTLSSPIKTDYDDENLSSLSLEDGVMYTRYLSGTDLQTVYSYNVVVSAAGGFEDARGELIEEWNPPLLRAGDVLQIISGNNTGYYKISSIINDITLSVELGGRSLESLENQEFHIFRPSKNPIWMGSVVVVSGEPAVIPTISIGLDSAGVAVGDLLILVGSGSNPSHSSSYTICGIDVDAPSLVLDREVDLGSGTYTGWVIREALLTKGIVIPYATSPLFFANTVSNSPGIVFSDSGSNLNSWHNLSLLKTDSLLKIDGLSYQVLQYSPSTRTAYVTPSPSTTQNGIAIVLELRPNRSDTPVPTDFMDRVPDDYLEIDLLSSPDTGDEATTSAASATVDLTAETFSNLGAKPGDLFLLLEGPDSLVDVGHGQGAYMIAQITGGGTTALLTSALTNSGSHRYGIRRRVS